MTQGDLSGFLATTAAVNALYFIVAVIVWWGLLRLLDIMGGQDFKVLWQHLKRSPTALSIYLAARLLAVAILAQAFLR